MPQPASRPRVRSAALLPILAALAPSAASAPGDVLQVRAKEVVLADGTRLADGVLVVEDGRVRAVGADLEIDAAEPFLEHEGVLTAGLVACQTGSGAAGESAETTRSLLAEARLVHAFDPDHSDFERALRAGITTVVLTPSSHDVAGGRTAVVKTAGSVVRAEGHLALSFSALALGHPSLGVPSDGGLEHTQRARRGSRFPTSFQGAIGALEARFASEDAPEDDPFARAARGELPVLLEAWNRHEVARAARFAGEHGLTGAIRGAPLAGDPGVLPEIVASGLGVVLGPFQPGQATRSLASVRLLQDAGVPVAFALGAPEATPESFRLSASLAVAAGADPGAVLDALTGVAARLAGVADRVGALRPGLDADFVLWSGDPLDLASRVVAVYVDGERVWRAEPRASGPAGRHGSGRRQAR